MRRIASSILGVSMLLAAGARAEEQVNFNRDVRPILSDTCFKCHGFDGAKRQADLRLDTFEGATHDLGGGAGAIVPGKPDESEAFRRISLDDGDDDKMPPTKSGMKLTDQQVGIINRWIKQGAQYQTHWSLVAPTTQPSPEVAKKEWIRNPIDGFVLARLEKDKLEPTPEADPVTLIRRVSLDLTGIPPTPAEVDAFVADQSPGAYERLVDRLLASPRYGERMALWWLDLARYADTNGYQVDTDRVMYRWRDWVIEAFNNNERFDQFTINQLAGDLIPSATLAQKIASGFNRNHRITYEGGSIPEEFRVEYVMDRAETTATTWLGLTMTCARCHDHKYDSITQKEYYKFFAFFNNVTDQGLDGAAGNSVPFIPAPLEPARLQLEDLAKKTAAAEKTVADMEPKVASAQATWEKSLPYERPPVTLNDGLVAHYPLDGNAMDKTSPCRSGDFREMNPSFASGMLGKAADLDGKGYIDCGDAVHFDRTDKFSFGAWIYTTDSTDGAFIAKMDETHGTIGFNLYAQRGGILHTQFINHVPDNMLTFVTGPGVVTPNVWHHVFTTYDGTGKAAGVKTYLDGKPLAMTVGADTLTKSISASTPLQIGSRAVASRFTGKVDDVRFYSRVLSDQEVKALGGARIVATRVAAAKRTPPQVAAVRESFMEVASAEIKEPIAKRDAVKGEHDKLLAATPTVMVMAEMEKPRETFVLKRGQYDMPAEKVTPGVPSVLPPLPANEKVSRLTLAKWMVDPANPLTARVTVNRFWEMFFGTGLARNSENLGSQTEWPSHPELLDWLATEFVRGGWDMKAFQKLIVTSSTYRQGSRVTPAMLEKDPANRLLARGPRMRLQAETIRDEALAISGLLVDKLGGPSVKPYQPPGIWEELTTAGQVKYVQDKGESLYRRSLYTFWKRTIPPPGMSVFDAPSREVCIVNRQRTNTPLQALALLNDTVFVEASRKLAERAMNEGGVKPAERITHAFRLAVARKPTEAELKILLDGFNYHLANYFSEPESAAKLSGVGESAKNPNLDARELAAYTATASVILNMDQTITKE